MPSKDIESKKRAITKVGKKLHLRFDDAHIEEIAKAVASNSIGLKDSLRYMFHKFNIRYSNDDLNALVAVRGALVHSGKYYNYEGLLDKTDVLFNLLIAIILSMLGWDTNVRRLLF
jgi:beta-N-acetylglucosaminidase